MRTQGTYYIRGTEVRKDGRTDGRTEGRNAENYVPPLFFEKAGDNKISKSIDNESYQNNRIVHSILEIKLTVPPLKLEINLRGGNERINGHVDAHREAHL